MVQELCAVSLTADGGTDSYSDYSADPRVVQSFRIIVSHVVTNLNQMHPYSIERFPLRSLIKSILIVFYMLENLMVMLVLSLMTSTW